MKLIRTFDNNSCIDGPGNEPLDVERRAKHFYGKAVGLKLRGVVLAVFIALLLFFSPLQIFSDSFPTVNADPMGPGESRTQYNLNVDLNYENASLTVEQSVVYTNTTPIDLDKVVFNVTPAHFNAFTLVTTKVDGTEVSPTLDDMVMEVPLPAKLLKGKSTTIELDYRVNVPKRGGRFGVGDGVIALGNWFPIMAVYNDSRLSSNGRPLGWSIDKYVEVGDPFFSEAADYDVTVDTSSPVTIAHTGAVVSKDAKHWQFQAKDVRDFAMAISNRYQTKSVNVNGVEVTAYYLPEDAAAAPQYLSAATQALLHLGRLIMPYPYPSLDIAEVFSQSSLAEGQEYPNMAFISNSVSNLGGSVDSYLNYIVMHEVTHQWFYSMVGDDQVYQPWLDEAFATWFPYDIVRMSAPNILPSAWQARVTGPLADSIKQYGDSPVDSSIYDFSAEAHYYDIIYRKGAMFLDELYNTMGDADFFSAMKDYSITFRDRVATPMAFFDLFQSHTSKDLSPVIAKYFSFERYSSSQPLKVSIEYPQDQVWSGTVTPKISANYPITQVTAFIEEDPLPTKDGTTDIAIDTTKLKNGEDYLLTIQVAGGGQIAELTKRIKAQNDVKSGANTSSQPSFSFPGINFRGTEAMSGLTSSFYGLAVWVWIVLAVVIFLMGIILRSWLARSRKQRRWNSRWRL